MRNGKTAITYTLDKCVKCMRCVQNCPTSALSMHDNRITIRFDLCVSCEQCIELCHNQGMIAKGSTIADLDNYDYTVGLIPSAMLTQCKTVEEAQRMLEAIRKLGFDEVIDITDIEGAVFREIEKKCGSMKTPVISSLCPVVNELIALKYPMLEENLLPYRQPHEIAAKRVRERLKDRKNTGIFYFCECASKLLMAKYPYGNMEYETDHALAIVDIFPLIRERLSEDSMPLHLCKEGLLTCNPMKIKDHEGILAADGYVKVNEILDMTEFGQMNELKGLYLYSCFNGCLGGHLLWGNSYLSGNHYEALAAGCDKPAAVLTEEELSVRSDAESGSESGSFKDKLAFFRKVNEQLEQLPGYDCSACGMQTCRIMAEEIVRGNKTLADCHILKVMKGSTL